MSETKTKNLCTVPAADLTDSQYFIAEDGGELKRIPKAQVVLKKLEKMLATDTENLAGGGEVTAQELLDALAEQVANKLLAKSQVVNNLLATVEGNPLDATQGKALKELIDTTNNNLSKKLFVKIGDTSNGNHSQIDQIADFYGITWVNSNYNSTFGGQWCFIDSTIIDNSGPYAIQRIMSCENAAILATRYCTKGTWGAWNVGVTKSDLYPSYNQVTLFSDVKADVTDKSITITENGMVQVAAKTQATDGTVFIRLVINGACVYEGHAVSGKYRYLWTPIFPVKKGDIIKVTLQTGTSDGQRFVYFYKS